MADEDKKVVVPSSADSTIKPSDATRISPVPQGGGNVEPKKLKTIKLKPLKTVAPASSSNDEETISMKRESQESEVQSDEDATVGINRGVSSDTVLAPPVPEENEPSPEEDATVKIDKVSKSQQGPSAPAIPGVKQTIKLRPSSSSDVSDATAPVATQQPASKQTLKLTPTQSAPGSSPQQQVQETAGAGSQEDSTKRTIKLVAKKPSAPTVKLDSPDTTSGSPAEDSSAAGAPSSSKRTLKIRTTSVPPPPAPASSDMGMATEHGAPPVAEPPQMTGSPQYQAQMQQQQSEEVSSALTTVAASVSLIALAYFAYQLFSQYKGLFM